MAGEKKRPSLHWYYGEMDNWRGGIVIEETDEERDLYMIEVVDNGPNAGKFYIWVPKRGERGTWVMPQRGPLKGQFPCLCSAKAACEAHFNGR